MMLFGIARNDQPAIVFNSEFLEIQHLANRQKSSLIHP